MSLRHGVKAGELHRAAITMTLGPHADGQAASKKLRMTHRPYSFASVEDPARGNFGRARHPLRAAINFTTPLQNALKPGSRRYRDNPGEDPDRLHSRLFHSTEFPASPPGFHLLDI